MESGWRPVTGGVPQGSVLTPDIFDTSSNDLDSEGAEWILSQSVIYTKLGGVAEMPEGPAAVTQEGMDLDRLENWTGRNLMEFNTDNYKVLNLGRDSPTHHLCWGCPAAEQLCRKCSAKCGPGGHKVQHKPEMCPCHSDS